MKIFIDSANLAEIKEAVELGVVDGVTTNPTLISKEKGKFEDIIRQICETVDGPVCAETVSLDTDGIVKEGRELHKIHKNVVVKIPITKAGLKAVRILENDGIRCNVTLVFSSMQALMAAKAGASFISIFVGRLDDASHDGLNSVREIAQIFDVYEIETEMIVASIRNPLHVLESALVGADIATIPFKVIEQLAKHPLTDLGIEKFLEDWKKVQAR
ncbi:fructose-6-phosphate aldolase [candidate division KSB1 bacterium]|nr:fructose-6-phosphate aldolase [candidate division KSB1 bacterium]